MRRTAQRSWRPTSSATDLFFVQTDAEESGPATLESLAHRRRDLRRSWPLAVGSEYQVDWDGGRVFFTIGDGGSVVRLADRRAPPATGVPTPIEPAAEHLERMSLPTWARLGGYGDAVRAASSEDAAWGWAIPSVLRAAAGPAQHGRWPAAPQQGDEIEAATGYWAALLHLLLYSFAWARPDRGLRSWYDAGQPTADRRLRLIADTYLADGQLDWFAAWLWSTTMPPFGYQHWMQDAGFASSSGPLVEVDRAWCEYQERIASASRVPAPIGGGSDPLHLQGHCTGPLEYPDAVASMNISTHGDGRAVLVVDSAVGWYRSLIAQANALPSDPQPWIVDVVITSVGWIGAFTRSPQTGLWYIGDHALHLAGN